MSRFYDLEGLRKAAAGTKVEGLSDEELVLEYSRRTGTDAQEMAEKLGISTGRGSSALGAGFGMGVDQAQAMLAGTGAAVADMSGAEGLRDTLEAEVRQQQAQAQLARNPDVAQRVEDIKGLGDVPGYVAGQFGQQIPIMGGIIGASALGSLAGPVGAAAAGLGAGYTYGLGSLYNEAVEGGERKTGEAALKAIPYAAAEALVPLGLGKIARGAAGSNLLTATTRRGAIGQAAAGGVVTEGATEALQTELEISMRDDLSPEEKASRRLNAVVAGGLVGGGFSGAAGAFAKLPDPNADTEGKDLTSDSGTEVGNELDQDTFAAEVAARRRQRQEAARRKIEGSLERDPFEPISPDTSPVDRQRILEARVKAREDSIAAAAELATAEAEQAAALNNQLKELEQLGSSKLPQSEVEAIKAEMKLAQEQLEATRQGFSSAQELADAETRLNELEAEITAPVPKGTPARQFKQQQRARAAETLEERTTLEATIDGLKQAQFAENQNSAEQALLYELHLEKLQEQLDADAEARFARRAMRRIRGRGIKPSEMTAEQIAQVQADIDSRKDERDASLRDGQQVEEATETEVIEPTSSIVEPSPDEEFTVTRSVGGVNLVEDVAYGDLTTEEKASKPVQDQIKRMGTRPEAAPEVTAEPRGEVVQTAAPEVTAEPRGEVVQTAAAQEELATEEEIEASEIADSEKEARAAAPKLQAVVRSEDRKNKGPLTMSQPLIAAAARHLRAVTPNGFKQVYQQGGAVIDDKATAEASEFLDQIRDKYHEILRLSDIESNLTQNAGSIKEGDVSDLEFDPDSLEAIDQQARVLNLPGARRDLKQAIDEFVDLVGGETNANAINAVIKKLNRKKYTTDTKGIRDKMAYARSTFGVDEKGAPRRRQTKFNSKADFAKEADVAFSSALRRYINGELDATADVAPKGRSIRPSRERQERIKKAREVGVELTEEELQAGAEQGGSAYGRTSKQIEDSYERATQRYEARVDELEDKLSEGKLSQNQYERQVATAERKMREAENSRQRQYDRMEQAKGLEGIVIRALGKGDRTISGKMLRKAISTILRKIPKTDHPTFSFEDVKESSYDPTKGKGGHITFRRSASPEEVGHEVLHSLLQGIVYRNSDPNLRGADKDIASTVTVLRGYVQQLINADLSKINLDQQTKQKASEVIAELRTLANQGSKGEVAAILELISYGNTMRDFKLLLTKLPKTRNAETASWKATLRGIWEQIRRIMSIALGNDVSDTAANDILDASIDLLNRVSEDVTRARPQKRGARVLKQSVRSGNSVPLDGTANPAAFNIDLRDKAQTSDWILSTKFMFDMLGWDKRMKWSGEKLAELNKVIRRDLPGLEKVVRGLNPYYGMANLSKFVKEFKSDKHTGYLRAEEFASVIRSSSKEDVQSMFDYLDSDGDASLLEGVAQRDKRKQMLDSIKDFIDTYVDSLDPKSRKDFTRRPLSESLFFVSDTKDVGSRRFGMGKINQIIGRANYRESNIEDDWMFPDQDKTLSESPDYYRVIKRLPNGEVEHQGFIHREVAASYNGSPIDSDGRDLGYEVVPDVAFKVSETADGKYIFSRQMTARQALDARNAADGREKLAMAFLNTVGSLANYYASRNYANALYNEGRKEGKLDIDSLTDTSDPVLAFDSVEQLNKYNEHYAEIDGVTYVPRTAENIRSVNEDALKSGKVSADLNVSGTYVRVPQDSVKWGALAGKILPGPVFNATLAASSPKAIFDTDVGRTYNKLLRFFKQSKTIYNPSTHVTNAASNVTIAMIHGIERNTVIDATNMLIKYYTNPDKLTKQELALVNGFMNSGAVLGDFSTTEVKEAVLDAVRDAMNSGNEKRGAIGWAMDTLNLEKIKSQKLTKYTEKLKAAGEKVEDVSTLAYATEDNAFRFAAFMTRAGQVQADKGDVNLTAEELRGVGIDARQMFLDYDIDSKYLQYARQTVLPFASWTYAIMPVLAKSIITQPWRIANIMTAYAALDVFASMLAGEDDDYRKRMGEMYNERVFGIGPHSMIRIPFMGSDEQPVYYKLGDYLPLASTFKGTPNPFFGVEGWPSGLTPNGPILSTMALMMNTDLYTGKDVFMDTDDTFDKLLKVARSASDTFLPPLIASRNRETLDKFISDAPTVSGQSMTPMWAARAFGFKMYDPYVSDEQAWKEIRAKGIMNDYKRAMYRAKREMLRSGSYDGEALSAELNRLNEDMREEVDKVFNRD